MLLNQLSVKAGVAHDAPYLSEWHWDNEINP